MASPRFGNSCKLWGWQGHVTILTMTPLSCFTPATGPSGTHGNPLMSPFMPGPSAWKKHFAGENKIGKEKTSAVMTADQMLILQEVLLEQKLKAYSCPLVVGSRCKVKGNTYGCLLKTRGWATSPSLSTGLNTCREGRLMESHPRTTWGTHGKRLLPAAHKWVFEIYILIILIGETQPFNAN